MTSPKQPCPFAIVGTFKLSLLLAWLRCGAALALGGQHERHPQGQPNLIAVVIIAGAATMRSRKRRYSKPLFFKRAYGQRQAKYLCRKNIFKNS